MRCLLPSAIPDASYDDLVRLYTFPVGASTEPGDTPDPPWIRAVLISTVDGSAQGNDAKSGSLSSAAARRISALQRSLCDVILVGARTARVENYGPVLPSEVDPALRSQLELTPLPAIAVVSASASVGAELVAARPAGVAPVATLLFTGDDGAAGAPQSPHTQVLVAGAEYVDMALVIDELVRLGYRRILCEGGPGLIAQIVAAQRLNDLCLTISPELVAGDHLRIQHGPPLDPPVGLRLAHLLTDEDQLFTRYVVAPPR